MADGAQSIEERKRGRPTWYSPALNDQVYELALLGQTEEQMAETLGVGYSTFTRWVAKHRYFREAIARGRAPADARVAASLYKRGLGYEYEAVKIFAPTGDRPEPTYAPYMQHVPPETAAASLWLRNRQPKLWREKTEVGVSGALGLELFVGDALAGRKAIVDATARVIEDESDASDDAKT